MAMNDQEHETAEVVASALDEASRSSAETMPTQDAENLFTESNKAPLVISLLCPTRKRPEGVLRLVRSALAMADRPDRLEFVFYIDNDDSSFPAQERWAGMIEELRAAEPEGSTRHIALNAKVMAGDPAQFVLAQAWNACAQAATGQIYFQGADDVEFKTPHWDTKVRDAFAKWPDGIGLVHGSDGVGYEGIAGTLPFVSQKWTWIVGYFVPPWFSAGWTDAWLQELADRVFRRQYIPDMLIEHMHAVYGKAEWDENYANAKQREQNDQVAMLYQHLQAERWAAATRLWNAVGGGTGTPGERVDRTLRASSGAFTAAPLADVPGKRVIAFSLYGDKPMYLVGAIKNAQRARTVYPGWTCRFYYGASVPLWVLQTLAGFDNVELVDMTAMPEDHRATFWRFLAAEDPNVEVVLSRDTDSRVGEREAAAVGEWLDSGKTFHIMRESKGGHAIPVPAGMWGVRADGLRDIARLIAEAGPFRDAFNVDQDFLANVIYPRAQSSLLVHDESWGFEPADPAIRRSFPVAGSDGVAYVGQGFDEQDVDRYP